MRLLFVGEKPSGLAHKRKVSWTDGRLAAKQLFDALGSVGIDPAQCVFLNLFGDDPESDDRRITPTVCRRAARIRRMADDHRVVALGKRVSDALRQKGVPHLEMVHPAARGAIRRKDRYVAHVA